MVAIVVIAIFGLFTAEIARDFAPTKLAAAFVVLAWVPLLIVHELGHAIAARVCGGRVAAVVFGFGRPLWVGEFRGIEFVWRSIPVEGFTLTSGVEGRGRRAFVYFAGPGAELLVAGGIVLAVGPCRLFSISDSIAMIALQSVCVAAVVSATVNLIPAEAKRDENNFDADNYVANDGLGIIRSLFGK